MTLSKRAFVSAMFLSMSLSLFAQSAGDPLQTLAQKILTWITGPFGVILVTLGFVFGGFMIMFGHGAEGWSRLAKVLIGGACILGAVQLVNFLLGA